MHQVIEADLTWTGTGFTPGHQIAVDTAGVITDVGRLGRQPTKRLLGTALLPGMVNAHSHAFQRGLRGRGERFPEGAGTFWSWREAMYELVRSVDPDTLYELSKQAFREMLSSGITTVGEFHYLHHATESADFELDRTVLAAAADAGIRIVLLTTYYRTGGIDQPLGHAQKRFETTTPEVYLKHVDQLGGHLRGSTQTLGTAVHSIRAAPVDDIRTVYTESTRRGLPMHIHVEEQRKEIEASEGAYGRRPMRVLLEELELAGNLTAVHCTHTIDDDLCEFVDRGGTVCICPLTEANLGDGVPRDSQPLRRSGITSLGTDSNARIAMWEEMRWLEYAHRLTGEVRGVFTDSDGSVAPHLYRIASENGAAALGLNAGKIVPGAGGDFVAVDLSAPALAGWDDATLIDSLVFGADSSVVKEVCVGGKWTVF